MTTPNTDRLYRIEEKLDKLSELVIALARAEEKISHLTDSNATILKNMLSIDDRVSSLEVNTAITTRAYGNLSKLVWSVLGSTLTAMVIWFFSKHFQVQ